jgi:hypothetical protein
MTSVTMEESSRWYWPPTLTWLPSRVTAISRDKPVATRSLRITAYWYCRSQLATVGWECWPDVEDRCGARPDR